jgi:phage tail tape-measure protein
LHALKRKLPEKIIRKLARHPVAVISTLSLSMRVGKDAFRVRSGKIDAPEFRARTGGHLGALSGGLAAASVGSAIGTVVAPGIGTILGAFAGGIVGEELGARGGRKLVQQVERILTGRPPNDNNAKDDDKT